MEYQILKPDVVLEIPPEVALCPYCNTRMWVQFDSWVQEDDGTWAADSMMTECDTEPDFDDKSYDEWWQSHSDMPYVYLLPVDEKIKDWVNAHYRFELEHDNEPV